jgi:hypothetical protein
MPKSPSNKPQTASDRKAQTTAKPQSPRATAAEPGDAPVVFPFARTAEDDELRDLSGYGWGV